MKQSILLLADKAKLINILFFGQQFKFNFQRKFSAWILFASLFFLHRRIWLGSNLNLGPLKLSAIFAVWSFCDKEILFMQILKGVSVTCYTESRTYF